MRVATLKSVASRTEEKQPPLTKEHAGLARVR